MEIQDQPGAKGIEPPPVAPVAGRALPDLQPLSPEEVRILASLTEKEVTTPAYYPLTIHALVNACNQKSCRDPVTQFDEKTVSRMLETLRDSKLVWEVAGAESRTLKYRQRLSERFAFSPAQQAVLCELMLRGPQTAGELRSRAERMHPFAGLDEVHATLQELATHAAGPWVAPLPRQAGRKETRYTQLLGGLPPEAAPGEAVLSAPVPADGQRLAPLEQEIAILKAEVAELRQAVESLRKMME